MPTPILDHSIVQRSKDIPFTKLDDELLAIDSDAEYCYSLNETAGRVWELIQSPIPVAKICAQLCSEYRVDPALCLQDVTALLEKLHKAGLVRSSETG